jgi:hypothetical protein
VTAFLENSAARVSKHRKHSYLATYHQRYTLGQDLSQATPPTCTLDGIWETFSQNDLSEPSIGFSGARGIVSPLSHSETLHPVEPYHLVVWQRVLELDSHLGHPDALTIIAKDELRWQMLVWTPTCGNENCDHVRTHR